MFLQKKYLQQNIPLKKKDASFWRFSTQKKTNTQHKWQEFFLNLDI
jgi:hypothetical protein